jgi:hypothetical protein
MSTSEGSLYGPPDGQSQGVPMPDAPAGLPQQQLQGVQTEMAAVFMRMVATAATAAAEAARLPLVLHRPVRQIERRNPTNSFQNLRCLLQETENKKWRNGEVGAGA